MRICNGEIKGDPDIAGIGVVLAIFLNAALAIVLSTILWFYVFLCTSDIRLHASKDHPRWTSVLRDTLVMQGDSLLISALAIMVASLVNICKDDETPLYHIFIARALADTCLIGHSASIILLPRTEHNWNFRLFLLFCAIVLWQYWSFIAIERFRWFSWETPHCFENHNVVPGEYEHWIIASLFLNPLTYVTVYLNAWECGRRWTETFESLVVQFPRLVLDFGKDMFKSRSTGELVVNACLTLATGVGCVLFLFFAILVPASCRLLPIQSAIFFWWEAYDVITARAANAHIVVANPEYRSGKSFQNNDNPEHDWGFGQILPLVMLLLPLLTALDYWKSKRGQHTSMKSYTLGVLTVSV